ncbi:MAG: GntR family transcriptional regulator [Pseudomonadota bacterium]
MAGQAQAVIQSVIAKIDSGALIPGAAIDEEALTVELDVSQTPIREALLKLEARGLVQRAPRKGAVIFKPTIREFLSIMEVHAKLEGQAAGLAARRLSAERRSALEAAVRACEQHHRVLGDSAPDAYYQLNMAFHYTVAEASGNAFLLDTITASARRLIAYYRARYRFAGSIAASAVEHRSIATAILDGDSAQAEAEMAAHVQLDQMTALDLLTIFE